MERRVADTTIDRPAEEVWEAIRDFGDLGWYPHVATCEVVDDVRTVTHDGRDLQIDEQLTSFDDEERSFSYLLTDIRGDTTLERPDGETYDIAHLSNHLRAGMTVEALGASTSKVTYWLEVDDGHDEHVEGNARNYQAAIDQLKAQLEGTVHPDTAGTPVAVSDPPTAMG